MSKLSNTRPCEFCGKKFIKNTKWHEYCSDSCKMKGWHIQKGEEAKIEKRDKK